MTQTPIGGPPPSAPVYRFTSDDERNRRLGALREAMRASSLSALVVAGRDDIRYRGRGFYVSDVWQLVAETHVVILPEGDPIFIGGQVFGVEQADVVEWAKVRLLNGNPGQEIAKVFGDNGITSGDIGIVGLSDAAFAAWHLSEMLVGQPGVTPVDATALFEAIRQVNSDENLSYFDDTAAVLKRIYADIEPHIKPGMTEIELAALSHSTSRLHGLRDPMVLLQTTPFGRSALEPRRRSKRTTSCACGSNRQAHRASGSNTDAAIRSASRRPRQRISGSCKSRRPMPVLKS